MPNGTFKRTIVVTGGAGFIGSHVVRLFVHKYPDYKIINLDKLTYAGNLANLTDIEDKPNYLFVKADICDESLVNELFTEQKVDGVSILQRRVMSTEASKILFFLQRPMCWVRWIYYRLQKNIEKMIIATSYSIASTKWWNFKFDDTLFTERPVTIIALFSIKAASDHFVEPIMTPMVYP